MLLEFVLDVMVKLSLCRKSEQFLVKSAVEVKMEKNADDRRRDQVDVYGFAEHAFVLSFADDLFDKFEVAALDLGQCGHARGALLGAHLKIHDFINLAV